MTNMFTRDAFYNENDTGRWVCQQDRLDIVLILTIYVYPYGKRNCEVMATWKYGLLYYPLAW